MINKQMLIMEDLDLGKLYNVYRTTIEMMRDRRFVLEETEGLYLEDLQEYAESLTDCDAATMSREDIYRENVEDYPEIAQLCRIPTHQYCETFSEYIDYYNSILQAYLKLGKGEKYQYEIADELRIYFTNEKNQRAVVYFYPLDTRLSQTNMDYVHSLVTRENIHTLVMVTKQQPTHKVSSVLGIMGSNAQLFNESELVNNPTKHQLVPKHILCTDPEKRNEILNRFCKDSTGKIRIELIPGLFTNDPVAKYYNYKPDDLIEIHRPRKDGFYDLYYRIVTHPMTDRDKK